MPFLINYWKPIAAIASIAIIFMFGWYKGYSYEKKAYDAYKSQIEAISKEQERKNAETARKQAEITDNLAKGYADAVKKLNSYYHSNPTVKWLRSDSDTKTVSKISDTSEAANGKTESNKISTAGVDPLDCASDVLQLLHLQKWIEQQLLIQ